MSKPLLAILALVLILGAGVFARFQMKPKADQVATPAPVVSEPTVTVSEPIDTSDWKTYRNEEYGFEFRYPELFFDLKVINMEEKVGVYTKPLPKEVLVYLYENGYSIDDQHHQISIHLNAVKGGVDFETQSFTDTKLVPVKIDGENGEIVTEAKDYAKVTSDFNSFVNDAICSSLVFNIVFNEVQHPDGDLESYFRIGCSDNMKGKYYREVYRSLKFFKE